MSAYWRWKRTLVGEGGGCGEKVVSARLVCILPWHADDKHLYGRPEDWYGGDTDSDDWAEEEGRL